MAVLSYQSHVAKPADSTDTHRLLQIYKLEVPALLSEMLSSKWNSVSVGRLPYYADCKYFI
jgi:hypothetical protein